jgi:hypothetical protein
MYLGVYFSRSLKLTQHIGNHIKDNIDKKLNGMIRILGKHGHFHIEQPCAIVGRSTEFHNALPNSMRLILPCLPKILIIPFN